MVLIILSEDFLYNLILSGFNFQPPYIGKGCVAKCTKDLQRKHFYSSKVE